MNVIAKHKAMENVKRWWKKSWKVMEFEELKRIRTLLHSCRIYLFGVSLLKDNIPTCVPKPVICFVKWEIIANSGRIK